MTTPPTSTSSVTTPPTPPTSPLPTLFTGPPPARAFSAGPRLRSIDFRRIPDAGATTYYGGDGSYTPEVVLTQVEQDRITRADQQTRAEEAAAERMRRTGELPRRSQYDSSAEANAAAIGSTGSLAGSTGSPIGSTGSPNTDVVGRVVSGPGSAPRTLVQGKPGQKAWKPYGGARIALYDRSPMTGSCGPAGTGKALPIDLPIPTPDGWTTMGALKPGDYVFDEAGEPTRVTAISPIQYDHDCFQITTDDGVTITADAEHEWTVFDLSARNLKTLTTRYISENLLFGSAQRTRWAIPVCQPIQYPEKDLPINPYVFGVWLGDGSKRDNTITCYDLDIMQNIVDEGHTFTMPECKNGTVFGIHGLGKQLRDNDLKNNKHIPRAYMFSSVSQRLALVQGLMDTDGSISTRQGDCNFINKNKQLVHDLASILWSLGVKTQPHLKIAKMKREDDTTYECEVWQIAFTTSLPVFRLNRKSALQNRNTRSTQCWRYIKSVIPTESVPVKCIKVDNLLQLYLAGPQYLVTHNSRLYLEKIHLLCEKYPGSRFLIARKTRESISEAALYTYEDKVLPEGHPTRVGPRRSHRTQYTYPNGSMIVVAGLDKPQKIMSTEYDGIYVQEATECDREEIDMLSTRLRAGTVPYQQLLYDCNPDKPTHWLYQSSQSGEFPMHPSYHEDNPVLWEEALRVQQDAAQLIPQGQRATYDWPMESPDGRIGRYTQAGIDYLTKLDNLTGARKKRLRYGLWVSAEGAVFEEEWDADRHIVDPMPLPPHSWKRTWCVDFGFTKPLSFGKWAEDNDGRLYLYWEIYHTHLLVKDACEIIMNSAGWKWDAEKGEHVPIVDYPEPLPDRIVCDTDAEGVATIEAETGLPTELAYKGISDGVEAVKLRMRIQADKRPRIFFCRGAVETRDPELKEISKPQSTIEEIDGYVWDPKKKKGECPIQVDDHGMDMMRYLVCYKDNVRDKVKSKDIAQAAGSYGCMVRAIPSNRPGQEQHSQYSQRLPEDLHNARRSLDVGEERQYQSDRQSNRLNTTHNGNSGRSSRSGSRRGRLRVGNNDGGKALIGKDGRYKGEGFGEW